MKLAEIEALAEGLAPVIRDLMAAAIKPFADENADLKRQIGELLAVDHAAMIQTSVAEAIAAIPVPKDGLPGEPGKDGLDGQPGKDGLDGKDGTDGTNGADADPELIRSMVAEAVALIPAPADGKDADPAAVRQMVDEAVAALPPAEPGKDADPEVTAELVRTEVERAVAALPKPQDGRSVSVDDLVPLIEERLPVIVSEAVARIPAPKDGDPGKDGADGKLPIVKAWADEVHHEGTVVTHDGATYQAQRDTGKAPPHDDWICIAAAGRNGDDGRSFTIRGTYAETNEYSALDVVSLNGGAFVAKADDPGPCPGAGWQLMASQGKAGKPGERGMPGRGDRGEAGPPVVAMHANGEGLLTLVNADGSTVECDIYPLLAKVMN